MAKRSGAVHVSITRRHYKGKVYETALLRRSYREGGKVKNETVGNLSHLPPEAIDAIKATLAGKTLVDVDDAFAIERSLPHGHVAAVLGVLRDLDLERLICRERCRERDLVVAMVAQRLIGAGSKLSATRRFSQSTLGGELGLGEVKEAELLGAMDWLLARQQRIEKALAKRHLAGEGFMLYDLSSSYVEGRKCPLAALGHSRDGKRGTAQVNYGLVCSPEGRPVAIEVHDGSTQDQSTVPGAIRAVRERFAIRDVVFVGDRGMMTKAHASALSDAGVQFVSALKSAQIKALVDSGDLQLTLFDEVNLAEISSEQFPGERLVVCRNPALAAERKRKREDLLRATETELDKVRAMVQGPRGTLRNADAGTIGTRAGKVVNRFKVAKHFDLQITDGAFAYTRKHRADRRRGRAGRPVCDPHHLLADQAAHPGRGRARLQATEDGRASVSHDERPDRDPPDLPPPRRPRPRARLPLHARLLHRLRTPHQARAAPVHRHPATGTRRPRRTRHSAQQPRKPKPPAPARPTATPPTTSKTSSPTSAPSVETRPASAPAEHTIARLTKPTELQARAFELLNVQPA